MKYDELLKNLRICEKAVRESCEKCSHRDELGDCYNKLKHSAADAIEELQKPKWIPVSERLPMRNTKVLLAYKQGVTLGYLGAYPKEGEKAYFHGIHGWKHTLSSVTHWQYLPEPPKEETDA